MTTMEKAKNFWENNKRVIIAGGIAAASVGVGMYAYKCYVGGYRYGFAAGFNNAMTWLDENFPEESKAVELYERWMKENPDKITNINAFGNVVKN